jgi:hypothetical protein
MAKYKMILSNGEKFIFDRSLEELPLDETFMKVKFKDRDLVINTSHIVLIQELAENDGPRIQSRPYIG